MNKNGLALRRLATILGVSQPFLSQIRAGKRPLPEALKKRVTALGAYHLLITPTSVSATPGRKASVRPARRRRPAGGTREAVLLPSTSSKNI